MNYPQTTKLQNALLAWFGAHARVLPFRGVGDPYAVWVSEIMLQQPLAETAKTGIIRTSMEKVVKKIPTDLPERPIYFNPGCRPEGTGAENIR